MAHLHVARCRNRCRRSGCLGDAGPARATRQQRQCRGQVRLLPTRTELESYSLRGQCPQAKGHAVRSASRSTLCLHPARALAAARARLSGILPNPQTAIRAERHHRQDVRHHAEPRPDLFTSTRNTARVQDILQKVISRPRACFTSGSEYRTVSCRHRRRNSFVPANWSMNLSGSIRNCGRTWSVWCAAAGRAIGCARCAFVSTRKVASEFAVQALRGICASAKKCSCRLFACHVERPESYCSTQKGQLANRPRAGFANHSPAAPKTDAGAGERALRSTSKPLRSPSSRETTARRRAFSVRRLM